MAARSDGSLALSRVDGHPISALSLQDKVLLRKYSIPVSTDMSITAAETSLVQSERTIRSEGPQRAEDRLKVDQTDPTVFDSNARGSADPLVPIPSSVSKDSELPNTGEILRGDEELEKLGSKRNRERIVEERQIGRV